jgi:phage gpG-like protein
MDLQVDAGEIVAFGRSCAGAEPVVRTEMATAMERSIRAVEGRAKAVVPTDTHHLQRSITSRVVPAAGAGVVGLVGTNVPYGEVVEKGRGAGKPMPPTGSLLGWMRRHGIEAKLEYVVRRGIGRRGIPARPYLSRALGELEPEVRREFAQVMGRVLRRLGGG